MKPRKVLLLLIFVLITSCSLLENRQFIDEMDYQYDEPFFAANRDFMVISGDTGRDYRTNSEIRQRTPATVRDKENFLYHQSLEKELVFLENKVSNAEYDQYIEIRDKIGNTSQKIYYLRLSPEEKKYYLQSRNLLNTPKSNQSRSISSNRYGAKLVNPQAIEYVSSAKDITIGMSKDDVIESWGQPERKDTAGQESLENERWAYRKRGSVKYIYFEGGVVEGWAEQ